jgi:hypothetical protein
MNDKIYYIVETKKGWDWERQSVIAATMYKFMANRIMIAATRSIDKEACERCDYTIEYNVRECRFINDMDALDNYFKEELT